MTDFINLHQACIFLAVVALFPLANYILRRGQDPFSPFVFIGGVVFAVSDRKLLTDPAPALNYLPEWALTEYVLITGFSLLAAYAGWHYWKRRHPIPAIAPHRPLDHYKTQYDPNRMVVAGIIYGLVALVVFLETNNRFAVTSGYLRDLTFLSDPGAVLLIQALILDPGLFWPALFGIAAATFRFFWGFFSYGSRGGTFEAVVLAMVPFLLRGRRPPKIPLVVVGCVLAVVLGTLAKSRSILGNGEAPNRVAAIWVAAREMFHGGTRRYSPAVEFVVGAGEVYVVETKGNWDDGGIIWNTAVVFLPHEWFPNKADYYTEWGEGKYNGYLQQIRRVAGVDVPLGCAPTGFANVFVEIGWLFPVFWFLVGYATHFIYGLAVYGKRLDHQCYLVVTMVGLLYLVTQDLNAFIFNALLTFVPAAVAYNWCRVPAGRSAGGNPRRAG
jgi:hypothetical protein